MSERCEECAQLRLECDEAILERDQAVQGLAKQLLLECEGHARTQHWLDTFQGSLSDATWKAVVVASEVQGVVGLIAAIYAWRALVEQDEVWELLWQVKRCLDLRVPVEDIRHDLALLFGRPNPL